MKNFMKGILIMIIVNIIILIILLYVFKDKEEKKIDEEFTVQPNTDVIQLDNKDLFYTVQQCAQYYVDYMNDNNYDALNIVLDKNYKAKQNITKETLKDKLEIIEGNKIFVQNIEQKEENIDISIFFVNGILIDEDNQNEKEFGLTVIMDLSQDIFSIIPYNAKEEKDLDINLNINADLEDYYNEFQYESITDEQLIKNYVEYYKILAQSNSEKAFELLNEEYREKRFENSKENFEKYLQEIDIENIYPSRYTVNTYEDYTEYICTDKRGNYYIFKEKAIMQFNLELDMYTLDNETFNNKYEKSDNSTRVQLNVNKWNQMLNNRDYKAAYQVLDETFRNNNFPTLEDFEDYIKTYLSSYYKLDYGEFAEENGIYIQEITFKEMDKEETEAVTKKIIMQLNEGTDFVMSFNTFK